MVDSDCILDDDCCHCIAYGELPPSHECLIDTCEAPNCDHPYGGLPRETVCDNGNCFIAKVDCDPSHVTCDSLPPECEALERASVVDGCWGPCVTNYICQGFLYPGAACPEDTIEIPWSSCGGDVCGSATSCEPDPGGCGDLLTCGCGVEAICDSFGFPCYDRPAGAVCCEGPADICTSAG
jgi:hypothetical protein